MKHYHIVLLISAFILTGCASKEQARTGFLSDYSKLEEVSDNVYMYLAPEYGQGIYSKVIVDPVVAYFHEESKAKEEEKEGKIKREDIAKEDLPEYLSALNAEMTLAAQNLEFEKAAEIRDIILELEEKVSSSIKRKNNVNGKDKKGFVSKKPKIIQRKKKR